MGIKYIVNSISQTSSYFVVQVDDKLYVYIEEDPKIEEHFSTEISYVIFSFKKSNNDSMNKLLNLNISKMITKKKKSNNMVILLIIFIIFIIMLILLK